MIAVATLLVAEPHPLLDKVIASKRCHSETTDQYLVCTYEAENLKLEIVGVGTPDVPVNFLGSSETASTRRALACSMAAC